MIFQHVGHEPLGTLNPLLKSAGFRIRYVNFGRNPDFQPDLEGYNGLIILGGPMGVYEADRFPHLLTEMKLIEMAMKMNIPVLGVCLGSQLIASVLGADVRQAPHWEIGWYDLHLTKDGKADPLFAHYKDGEKIFQLHQDTFEIPKSAVHLGKTALLEGQAFRYGEKIYGLQFHLEADSPMIMRWLNRPENRKLIADSKGIFTAEKLETDTNNLISQSVQLGRDTFTKFIEIFKLPERPEVLGSTHGKPPKSER